MPAGLFFGHPSGRMGGRTLFPIHHSSSEPHHVVAEQQFYGPSPYDPFSSGSLILVLCAL